MSVAAVIFDFDGLLFDTESSMLASWQYEWRQHGLELDVSTYWVDHGGDVTSQRYDALARQVGPDYDHATSHARRVAYGEQLHASMDLRPGIRDWLTEAEQIGLRLAVASSSPREWVTRLLALVGCAGSFEQIVCGDDVAAPKPDPAVYRLALQRLGLQPESALAVEDAPHGVAAACAAGLRCVAIPNPHVDPARLSAADLVLASASEMTLGEVISASTS